MLRAQLVSLRDFSLSPCFSFGDISLLKFHTHEQTKKSEARERAGGTENFQQFANVSIEASANHVNVSTLVVSSLSLYRDLFRCVSFRSYLVLLTCRASTNSYLLSVELCWALSVSLSSCTVAGFLAQLKIFSDFWCMFVCACLCNFRLVRRLFPFYLVLSCLSFSPTASSSVHSTSFSLLLLLITWRRRLIGQFPRWSLRTREAPVCLLYLKSCCDQCPSLCLWMCLCDINRAFLLVLLCVCVCALFLPRPHGPCRGPGDIWPS